MNEDNKRFSIAPRRAVPEGKSEVKFRLDGDPFDGCLYSIQCGSCVHLRSAAQHTCDAFPDGLPFAIWSGQHDHTQPYEGDSGIRYERKDSDA